MKRLFNDNWFFKEETLKETFDFGVALSENTEYQPVEVPHDWLIKDTKNLYRKSEGWYLKRFLLEGIEKKQYFLEFDGIHMNNQIYLNGKCISEWKYGYTPQIINLTDFLNEGENILFVRVKQEGSNSRWYTGAGIFRNVWFHELGNVFVAPDDCYIHQEKVSETNFRLLVDYVVTNKSDCSKKVEFELQLLNQKNEVVSCGATNGLIEEEKKYCCELMIENPVLWHPDTPNLYQLQTKMTVNGNTQFTRHYIGFREITIDANDGLKINGKHLKIQGVCQHHDLGALGSAINKQALRRQLVLLKEMGVNAIRTAHNPFSKEFYELTDELGFLVQSEFVDMWKHPKNSNDYARFFDEWVESDVASWIKRDRNYSSVFMWSIGNEIYDTHGREDGTDTTAKLINLVKKYDYFRNAYITFGSNYLIWDNTQKAAELLDAVGYNYTESKYQEHHNKYPDWIIYGSETASVAQSRGVYHFPLKQTTLADDDEQCSSLGNSRTSWGAESIESCIIEERDCPYSLGQFLWSGFDYLGEPTPYIAKNSYLGQIDTAGFPKDAFYIIKAGWTTYKQVPMIHLFPYWDFSPGQIIDVRVTTNCPVLELFFNGNSLGKRVHDPLHGKQLVYNWEIPYDTGELIAVGYDSEGNALVKDRECSFGDVVELKQISDKNMLEANGQDLVFIEVNGVDIQGNIVKNANNQIVAEVSGAGRLVGIDNGDSKDYDELKGNNKRLFNGKLLLIVSSTYQVGDIQVRIKSPELPESCIFLKSKNAEIPIGTAKPIASELSLMEPTEIPIRKIELNKEMSEDGKIIVTAKTFPANAKKYPLFWRLTDIKGIDSDVGKIKEDGSQVVITPKSNGLAYIRCGVKNGKNHIDFYAQIEMIVSGLKESFLDPYQPISGGRYSRSNIELTNGNERGVATIRDGESWVIFDNVDFGNVPTKEIKIALFPLENNPFIIDIWQGIPNTKEGKLKGSVTYDKGSIWNTYQEQEYQLDEAFVGVQTITFVFNQKVHMKEFSFRKKLYSFEVINVVDNDGIYGDSYAIKDYAIEAIGNNVTINFKDFDFSEIPARGIQIVGRSPNAKNSIHLKLSDSVKEDQMILDMERSEHYQTQNFLFDEQITGKKDISFIFLPGSNFDFETFVFLK